MMDRYSYLLKVCLFADKDVGKKTLARSNFLYNFYNGRDYMSTIGVEFSSKTIDYGKGIRIQLWIISEKEYLTLTRKVYIHGSDGLILMYDITNGKTLDRLSKWCQMIKNYREDIPILLVGNKLDLEENRQVSKEQVEKFKENNNISSSIEIAVKTGENIEEMFLKILSMILNIGLKELKTEINKRQKERLEESREALILRIDRVIKINNKKLKGMRNLKNLKRYWSEKHYGATFWKDIFTFEEYVDIHKRRVLNLAEYKNKIINAKDLTEVMKVREKVKNLLFIINFR